MTTLKKRNIITKFSLIILMVSLFFIPGVQAADVCATDATTQLVNILDIILTLLSRIRIVPAILAGKLMSNTFIYGSFMNLDYVLYYLWNMMRTLANFMLMGVILYSVIKSLISEGFNANTIITYIIKGIGSVLLINISWFAIGAIVDVSTILTSAVGSLSNTYIAQNNDIKTTIIQSLNINKGTERIIINADKKLCEGEFVTFPPRSTEDTNDMIDLQQALDMVMPSENSISGPFVYIGASVLNLRNYLQSTDGANSIINQLFIVSVKLAITATFFIILVIFLFVALARVITLWTTIILIPLIIISKLYEIESILKPMEKFINIGNLIKLIFAPVIAVGLMSLSIVAITIMQGLLQNKSSIERGETYMNSNNTTSSIGVANIFETKIKGDILGTNDQKLIKDTFTNILLIIFTLFILFGAVSALQKYLNGTLGSETIDKMINTSKNLAGSISINTPRGKISPNMVPTLYNQTMNEMKRKISSNQNSEITEQENKIRKLFDLDPLPRQDLINAVKTASDKFKRNIPLESIDYNKFITASRTLIREGYKPGKSLSLESLGNISGGLESFIRNLTINKTPLNRFGDFTGTLPEFIKDESYGNYLKRIYSNTTYKPFLNTIYKNLGGDPTKLNSDGSDFLTKPMVWNTNQ